MRLTCYGAAGEVTGSKHLVELDGHRILLDCGLFQGRRQESRAKNSRLAFDPGSVDAVILSHAHLDHVGQLPILLAGGFRGPIYSTTATRDLAELILLDAAHIQEQDALYAQRHRLPEAALAQPLFRPEDIPAVMRAFRPIDWSARQSWQPLAPGLQFKFYDAGHILGSVVTVLSGRAGRVVYTGDLGRRDRPLLNDPEYVTDAATALLSESTYGLRPHRPLDFVEQELAAIINTSVDHGGKIIVPAFSLGRTQELIYFLHQLTDCQRIPRLPIVVDSPLAERITGVFARHQREYDQQSQRDFSRPNEDPLAFRNLTFTHTVEESKSLNVRPGPMIIISSSGMLSGGRVLHHLRHLLPDPKNTVLMTGYQADHTPGRRLIKGAPSLTIFGQPIPVKAKISVINDLSAHADAGELIDYAEHVPSLTTVFLVHGEEDRRTDLRASMIGRHPTWRVVLPAVGQPHTL